jgi:DNA modification methylase
MTEDTCRSEVELGMLAPGMAKQHERFQDALQELIDNSVAAIIDDESYFDNPAERVEIVISITRDSDSVQVIVADNGPGIKRNHLRNDVFRTGNKSLSDGILNNVGWGLKASIAWFERTLKESAIGSDKYWFTLATRTTDSDILRVDGPITGNLPISTGDNTVWEAGLKDGDSTLVELDHGTRVQVHCSREQFDADVWPSAQSLEKKAQTLRELLGVKFRRLLNAREDNQIYIHYNDLTGIESGFLEVIPISPIFAGEDDDESEYTYDEFTIEDEAGNSYQIEFERGTLDYEMMTDAVSEDHPGLLTSSGRFRTRFKPSQAHQGVDIYANGRVLMTSVFSELFDLTRNNEYNYFGGILRILPDDPAVEVPTDNKKTRIDTNSKLWSELQETLSQEEYQPEGKDYHSDPDTDTEAISSASASESDADANTSLGSQEQLVSSLDIDSTSDLFDLHQKDARTMGKVFAEAEVEPDDEGLLDVTITSPPYFDLKDYGYDTAEQIGQDSSYDRYLNELRETFRQVYTHTKDSGTLWIVANTFKNDSRLVQLPNDIAQVAQNLLNDRICPNCSSSDIEVPLEHNWRTGTLHCRNCDLEKTPADESWILQDVIIWDKQRALPYSEAGKFRNTFEYILCFSKTDSFKFNLDNIRIADPSEFQQWWVDYPERYHPLGKLPANVWQFTTPSQGAFGELSTSLDHPAPFPPDMVERLLNLTTEPGDTVLDPFSGSGMVLAQAEAMDRNAIGFELNSDYIESYQTLKEAVETRWNDKESVKSIGERQQHLARINGGLRQIKQARELLRHAAKEQNIESAGALDVDAVFSVNQHIDQQVNNSQAFVEASFLCIVDDSITARRGAQLERLFHEILSNATCTGYGVDLSIQVLTRDNLITAVRNGEFNQLTADELYLYDDEVHFRYADTLTLAEWVEQTTDPQSRADQYRGEAPPIISNLGLEVYNPRRDMSMEWPDEEQEDPHHQIRLQGLNTKAPLSAVRARDRHAD